MLKRYQREGASTFKEHKPLDAHKARLLNWGIGLGGEAGEVQEVLKHHIYAEEPLDKMSLAKELGDVFWYISAIAETSGIQLEDIAQLNLAKLQDRYYTGAYTDGEAQNRHAREATFINTPIYKILEARILKKAAPMNVIFVGPDGSGKTTYAKLVAKQMGFKYHKCNHEQQNKPELALQLLDSQINVVYDRFYWPDDILYSHIKHIEHTDEYLRLYGDVTAKLEERNTLYIYVYCSEEELIERSVAWKDDYVSTDQLGEIMTCYRAWLRLLEPLHLSTFILDTSEIKIDSVPFQEAIEACCKAIEAGQKVYSNQD